MTHMNGLGKARATLQMAATILAMALLAACAPVDASQGARQASANTSASAAASAAPSTATPLTACHATGDPAKPYVAITITGDFSPVPVNGCPTSPVPISDGKIVICHATGSDTNPYTEITVNVDGLDGHGTHEGDVLPASQGGCPARPVAISGSSTSTLVCHATEDPARPYEESAVKNADLDQYLGQHPNDISPVPVNGCPSSPVVVSNGKVTICHATGSQANPYNEITVSSNGLNGHARHDGDIIPAPESGCPASPVVISGGKVTICHATGSQTNPYNEITVSVNGLNGHNKHEGDIIPVPAGGCPASPAVDKQPKNEKPKNDKKP